MKNLLLPIALLLFTSLSYSQLSKPQKPPIATAENDCYLEWYNEFQKFGAEDVKDGTQEVIIVLCKFNRCDCYLGKVDVQGGQIQRHTLYILQEDGTYDKPNRTLSPKYGNAESKIDGSINYGMSPAYLTSQDETVYLMFYKSLSKVPKKPKHAPRPVELK